MRGTLAKLACAVWLSLVAGAGIAQDTVRVRSGEHADFTRLVFYLPDTRDWRLGRSGDGYRIGFGDAAVAYDTDDVFDFIPRTRIAALLPEADGLQLDLACNCHMAAFVYRPGIVVVDVRDGPPPADARHEAPFTGQSATGDARLASASDPDLAKAPPRAEALPGLVAQFVGTAPADRALSVPKAGRTAPSIDTGVLRQDMIARMSAALSQGLVDPAVRGSAPRLRTPPNETDERESAMQAAALASPGTAPGGAISSGFRVSTAFDIAFQPRRAADIAAQGCWPAEAYGFLLAPPEDNPMQALASARGQVVDDRDTTSQPAVLDLARAYLSLGFGAEAAQVLTVFSAAGPEAEFLALLATVLDQPGTPGAATADRLAAEVSCDSPGALLALLATGGRNLPDTIDSAAVLRTVSQMPVHLRTHLAPALSQALRQARQDDLAHAVRETVHRTGQVTDPGMQLEDARATEALVQRAEVRTAKSQAETGDRAAEAAPVSEGPDTIPDRPSVPSAASVAQLPQRPDPAPTEAGLGGLADVLDQMAEGRRPVNDDTLAEAAALIHESKGSPAGVSLFEAFVPALVAAQRHREGLAMIRRLDRSSYADSYALQAAADDVLADLAVRGRAGDLILALAEGQAQTSPDQLPPALRLAIGVRLVDLGLMTQARLYAPPIGPDASAPARLLQARIALGEGEPMEALARIATLDGAEAARLRAEALALAGASADAARILRAQGEDDTAAAWAWAGEDWSESAVLLPPGPRRDLAVRLSQQLAEASPAETGGLPSGGVVGDAASDGTTARPTGPALSTAPGATGADGSSVMALDGPESYLAQRRSLLTQSAELRDTVRLSLSDPVQ